MSSHQISIFRRSVQALADLRSLKCATLQAPLRSSSTRPAARAASLLSRDPSPNGAMSMDERINQAKIVEAMKLKKAAILQFEKGLGPAERSRQLTSGPMSKAAPTGRPSCAGCTAISRPISTTGPLTAGAGALRPAHPYPPQARPQARAPARLLRAALPLRRRRRQRCSCRCPWRTRRT